MAILGTITLDTLVFLLICIALILIGFFIGWFFRRSVSDSISQEIIRKPELSLERIVHELANDKRDEPYSNYCPKCGKQMEKKEQYCKKCGVDLVVKGHYPHNLF